MNNVENILHQLLADLFDEEKSRIGLMGSDFITSEMLPESMQFERALLDAFYLADEKEIPPHPVNINLLCKYKGLDKEERIRELDAASLENPYIRSAAIFIKGWAEQQLIHNAAQDILALDKVDYADVREKQSLMIDKLMALPFRDSQQSFNRLEIIEALEEKQKLRAEAHKLHKVAGATLHLYGLNESIPILEDGDVTLITAPPKSGKTTTGMILADINSIENDIDVLWLLTETSPRTIEERFEARELLIPGWALRKGIVDLREEPYLSMHRKYIQVQRDSWNTYGHTYIQYIAGARVSEIAGLVRVHKRLADSRHRPLLVIIDYLQRLAKPSGKNDVEALAYLSNAIKDIAVRNDCHIILFSQESLSSVINGDSRAHGSNTPIFIAQVHMTMKVLNCEIDIAITDERGEPLVNAIGRDRYWQRAGRNKRQSVVKYEVLRANDNEATEAFAAFENELFIMLDCSDPEVAIPQFARVDIENFNRDFQNPMRRLI